MKPHVQTLLISSLFLLVTGMLTTVSAQVKVADNVEFDKTVHDFGDVLMSDGAVKCTFTFKNTGTTPIAINDVATSCGCTDVKWSRESVQPGKSGTISATYTNDEGPYPFDKGLTVRFTGIKKPVILRIRGVSQEKRKSPEETYTVRSGAIGMKSTVLKCGNLEQGESKSDKVLIANLSSKAVTVGFDNVTDGLGIKVSPNPVPANSNAEMVFTVSSRPGVWGKNDYFAVPVVDGKKYPENKLSINAFTKENFSGMTEGQKADAPRPMFKTSTYSFGKIPSGKSIDAVFEFSNSGKNEFIAYKVDIDAPNAYSTEVPRLKTGEKGSFKVHVDTSGMPSGETLIIVTLTTNAPLRPIINLFITGWIE